MSRRWIIGSAIVLALASCYAVAAPRGHRVHTKLSPRLAVPPITCPSQSSCGMTVQMGNVPYSDGNGYVITVLANSVLRVLANVINGTTTTEWDLDYDLYNITYDADFRDQEFIYINLYASNGRVVATISESLQRTTHYCLSSGGHQHSKGSIANILIPGPLQVASYDISQSQKMGGQLVC
jgi:hypothetical protein